jgi:hypothetical protein
MKLNSFSEKTGQNLLNLCLIFAILLFITACVCNTDRNSGNETNKSNQAETPKNAEESNSSSSAPVKKDSKTQNKNQDQGDFIVEHQGVKNSRYNEIDAQIKKDKTLEKAADQLNRSLILPNDIYLRTKDCGEKNAFYNPNDQSITMCYELMEHFYSLYRESGDTDDAAYESMFDAVRFVFLHEMGHALIDTYKLPITANEEDAADRCSSFICIEELGDGGVKSILAAADAFRLESKSRTASERDLADEHLLQEQRFFNSLCMVYGSNSTKYSYIVEKGYLPEARAVRCPSEYERTAQSWSTLLAPWRKK